MKIEAYNKLIQLHRLANDLTQTSEIRRQAREDFETLFQASDQSMQNIIQDAIATAPSVKASFLYTYRAAATDYSRTHSFFSATHTFFHVVATRLTNLPLEQEQSAQENVSSSENKMS